MIIFKSIILSTSILSYDYGIDQQVFYFEGDYTQVAQEYYNKDKPVEKTDSSILYDVISKEIEEGKHNLD